MRGRVWATVNPTESPEKVEEAIRNVMGDIGLSSLNKGGSTVLEGEFEGVEALAPLRNIFGRMRIRDAASSLLTRIADEGRLTFGLNKQAAYAGRASFHRSRESTLGPIQIEITGDVEGAIRFLCR